MKIDRGNPWHWLWLGMFTLNTLAALLLRWFGWRRDPGSVVLYGHKLNGNLAALLAQARREADPAMTLSFLTMDPAYCRELRAAGELAVLAISPRCIPLLARAGALVTDHGLHCLSLLVRLGGLPAFDVWHGIPFKGFDADDFRVQHRYEETWLPSPRVERLYVERFGFDPARLVATGYARTDALVRGDEPQEALLARLDLTATQGKKRVLFAPTWKQDAAGRSVFPFGLAADEFFAGLDAVCARTGAVALFRSHLNSTDVATVDGGRIVAVPHADVPDTEGVLLASDVLVCDWSSIAFDWLLLERPTIFLDVPPPFAKGFSLGPEYRYGEIVDSFERLLERLEAYLRDPETYAAAHGARAAAVREEIYGPFADGRSALRCLERLRERALRS
ncbi:MAG: CDP-glycerol glycerophosphotransferase family protein [Arenimonas sp.]